MAVKVLPSGVLYDCHRCGGSNVDPDEHDCDSELPFDGERCPMCGERYESYLNHLSDCEP